MIHELRTYTVYPGKLQEYVRLAETVGRPIRGDRYGTLLGYWWTECGPLNQVVHLWEYADLGARAQARAALARDERWTTEYLPQSQPLLQSQESVILVPVDWYPLRAATGMGVYELRWYRLHPGKVPAFWALLREGLPAREKHSSPVGFWTTEIGPLNAVVHLWPYRDLAHRAAVRAAVAAEPAWQAFLQQYPPLVQAQESKLLVPTAFSPLR